MMKAMLKLAVLSAVVAVPLACASGGNSASLRWDVGDAMESQVLTTTTEVLERYQYEIERQARTPNPSLQTHWYERLPFDDEAAAGAEAVRTRFLMTARQRSQRMESGGTYNVRLTVENQARMRGGEDWVPMALTNEFRDYATEIAERLRQDLTDGFRVF